MRKSPQEKKRLSYSKDRRNVYGANDKASRKAIKKNKAVVNQSYRRTVKQTLKNLINTDKVSESADGIIKTVKRKKWKKVPDRPLGLYLKNKSESRI